MIGYLAQNHPLVAAFRSLPKTRTRPGARLAQPSLRRLRNSGTIFAMVISSRTKGDLGPPHLGSGLGQPAGAAGQPVFFAVPGRRADGQAYIAEAIQRGAVAIVGEKMPAGTALRVTYLQVSRRAPRA
jgi:UDP-N-acetylmuramoyl-L-alanyl-D-glutamate--2,6-diaminopimelate ligase